MDVLPLVGSSFVRRFRLERMERLRSLAPQRHDELSVVGVRDLARPVIELELLERCQSAVALLGQAHALALLGRQFGETVVRRRRLPQEGTSDERDAGDGKKDRENQGENRHRQAGA
jgi:hypothetical protein